MLLKTLKAAARAFFSSTPQAPVEYPLEIEERLNLAHAGTPVDHHLQVLFDGVQIGGESFVDLFSRCLRQTGTAVTPFNVFQRFQTRHIITQYFLDTLRVPGARAECGAYRGATALLLCYARRSRDPLFKGADFYLIDSFSGTSPPVEQDLIPVRGDDGKARLEPFFPTGKTDVTPDLVRGFFGEFPEARICPGWIPEVFKMLPEQQWAFVHLDLTIFEPTLASLEYFYPRLAAGGVILCDGSVFCPGAERAWTQFCTEREIPYAVLGHREAVLIKS